MQMSNGIKTVICVLLCTASGGAFAYYHEIEKGSIDIAVAGAATSIVSGILLLGAVFYAYLKRNEPLPMPKQSTVKKLPPRRR